MSNPLYFDPLLLDILDVKQFFFYFRIPNYSTSRNILRGTGTIEPYGTVPVAWAPPDREWLFNASVEQKKNESYAHIVVLIDNKNVFP